MNSLSHFSPLYQWLSYLLANGGLYSQRLVLNLEARDRGASLEEEQVLAPGALGQPLRVVSASISRALFRIRLHIPTSIRLRLSWMRHTSPYRLSRNKRVQVYSLKETTTHTLKGCSLLRSGQTLYTRSHLEQQQVISGQKKVEEESGQDRPLRLVFTSHLIIRCTPTKTFTMRKGDLLRIPVLQRRQDHKTHPLSMDLAVNFTPIARR